MDNNQKLPKDTKNDDLGKPVQGSTSDPASIDFNKAQLSDKPFLLNYFRTKSKNLLDETSKKLIMEPQKTRAAEMNTSLTKHKDGLLEYLSKKTSGEKWSKEEVLNSILTITYTNYIVMIEERNNIWPYEYMTFSRRIGELWEPFCKLCWKYPVNSNISLFKPQGKRI